MHTPALAGEPPFDLVLLVLLERAGGALVDEAPGDPATADLLLPPRLLAPAEPEPPERMTFGYRKSCTALIGARGSIITALG